MMLSDFQRKAFRSMKAPTIGFAFSLVLVSGPLFNWSVRADDLYAPTKDFEGHYFVGSNDVHYTPAGYNKIAQQVAERITAAFPQ